MTASTDEAREELRNRLPDVMRMAAGLAGSELWADVTPELLAVAALERVIACEQVCGIGGDE